MQCFGHRCLAELQRAAEKGFSFLSLVLPLPSASLYLLPPLSLQACALQGPEVTSICFGLHPNQSNLTALQHVANMMIRMKREFPGSQNSIFPVFDTLLLLDRNVDLLTPLATQLTYEGLIDEIYGIQNSESCGERAAFPCPGPGCSVLDGFVLH